MKLLTTAQLHSCGQCPLRQLGVDLSVRNRHVCEDAGSKALRFSLCVRIVGPQVRLPLSVRSTVLTALPLVVFGG